MTGARSSCDRAGRALVAFGYANGVVALAALALAAAASRAMQLQPDPLVLGLAAAGTLAIYGLDRLRDVASDRLTAPRRTAFVEAHRGAISAVAALAGGIAVLAGLQAGARVVGVAALVAGFGLAHRRLKHRIVAKPVYLVLTWTAVTVGLPLARDPAGRHIAWVVPILVLAIWANVILSNLKDEESAAAYFGKRRARLAAFTCSALGILLALLAPAPVTNLAPLPAAMGIAVLGYRRSETYAALCIDGALALGAALAWLL